jgi:hypothetical protein
MNHFAQLIGSWLIGVDCVQSGPLSCDRAVQMSWTPGGRERIRLG